MIKYAEFKKRILNALSDDGGTYTDDLIFDATISALDAILPWVSRRTKFTISGIGEDEEFELPSDCYKVDAVQITGSNQFAERFTISNTAKLPKSAGLEWMEWPQGSISFYPTLDAGKEVTVFYSAYFTRPAHKNDLEFQIAVPRAAVTGMVYWACAHCVVPGSVASSRIRQFNIKVDSGTPTDNALEQSARFLRSLFLDEMNRLPKQPGGAG